jgi:hypothetical protein
VLHVYGANYKLYFFFHKTACQARAEFREELRKKDIQIQAITQETAEARRLAAQAASDRDVCGLPTVAALSTNNWAANG